MTLLDSNVTQLVEARRRNRTVPAPTLPDAAAAYEIQRGVAAALGWFGTGCPRHWKSGAASLESTPTHAPLPPGGIASSPADLRDRPLRLRGIEAEIALRIRETVDSARAATLDDASAAALVDACCVSIEIVDSRWDEGLEAPPLARLADLQSHGALVLGEWTAPTPRDWRTQHCRVRIGTAPEQVFVGTHALVDPALVLPAWLRHATRDGAVLASGTVVTTGTWCGVLFALPGDSVTVEFDAIGSARVDL